MLPQKNFKPSFYFLILVILVLSAFIFPVSAYRASFNGVSSGYAQRLIPTGSYWNDIHAASESSGNWVTAETIQPDVKSSYYANKFTCINRAFVTFNTSSIGVSNTSYNVTIGLTGGGFEDQFPSSPAMFGFVSFNPANISSLQKTDWEYSKFGHTSTPWYYLSGNATNNVRYNFSISPDLVNEGGITAIGILIYSDAVNVSPIWTSGGNKDQWGIWQGVNHGTPSKRPILYVDYAPSITVGSNAVMDVYEQWNPVFLYTDVYGYGGSSAITYDLKLYQGGGIYWSDYFESYEHNTVSSTMANLAGDYNFSSSATIEGNTYTGWYNFSVAEAEYVTPTPTPTPYPVTGNFHLKVYDTSYNIIEGANVNISYNDNSTIQTLDTDMNGYVHFTVPSYRMVYGNITKDGYQQTNFIINFGTSYNSFQFLWKDYETPGEYTYYGNLMLTTLDSSDSSVIDFVRVDVYDDVNRTNLIDTQYTDEGFWALFEPMNQDLYYSLTHPSYGTQYFTENITSSPEYKTVFLTKLGLPQPTGGYNITITCIDASTGTYANNVWFTASKTSNLYEAYAAKTNVSGIAIISHVPPGLYYLTSLLSGYYIVNQTISVTNADISRTIYISPYTGTPYTTIPTFTPVVTPSWSGAGGVPGNAKEGLLNFAAVIIGVDIATAGILIGLCITCGCAIAIGASLAGIGMGSGAGIGALIGATAGFIGSCVIGFFPIWLLFIGVVLVFAVFFIFRKGGEE